MLFQSLVLCLGIQLIASQTCDEASGWHELNGACFRVSRSAPETQQTWQEARAACLADGGELASLHSQEEQDFVLQLATDTGLTEAELWIGLNQIDDRDGDLGWSDGTTVDYTNWANSQPMVGGLTYCTYSATEPGPGPFEFYPYANALYGLVNPDYDHPSDAGGVDVFFFGQNYNGNYVWCESLCEANERCAAAVFWDYHYLSYWNHVCMGRSDRWNILGPDSYTHSGIRSLTGGEDYGLWYSANCGLRKAMACKKPIDSDIPVTIPPTPIVDSYCPADYFDGGSNKCFRVVTIPSNSNGFRWDQALTLCRDGPGYYPDIASIHSLEENSVITARIQNYGWNYWIGLHYASKHDFWVWADNTEPVYTNWADGEPDLSPEYCVEMWSMSGPAGRWGTQLCDQERGFVCQTYKDANNIISTPAITTPHECPAGWTPYWYGCYQFQSELRTWNDAKTYCESQGSTLVTIHAEAENAAILVGADGNFPVWIGLQKNQSSGQYQWLDGWDNYYLNFDDGGQDNGDGCVMMKSNGKWNDTLCSHTHASLCKISSHPGPSVPPPLDGYCEPPWVKWGYRCYLFSVGSDDFLGATYTCRLLDGDLVSIGNAAENDFVRSTMSDYPSLTRAWIGLYRNPADTEYSWTDGTDTDYRNWAPFEPSNPINQLCAEIEGGQISNYPGSWYDDDCDLYKNFVCEAPQGPTPSYPTPTGEPGSCPSSDWETYGTDCFLFRPVVYDTWHVALSYCQYMSGGYGSLASINDYNENLFIYTRSVSHVPPATNPLPSVWIGLSKIGQGYPYMWVDGNDNLYRNWAPGEPNDWDGTQNCVRMYLFTYPNQGMWDDYYCSDSYYHGLVCKTPQGSQYANLNIDEAEFIANQSKPQNAESAVNILNKDTGDQDQIDHHQADSEKSNSPHSTHDYTSAILGSVLGGIGLCFGLVAVISALYWRKKKTNRVIEEPAFDNPLAEGRTQSSEAGGGENHCTGV